MMNWHCHTCFHRMLDGVTAGGIAIVIDVLRASTTITTALANGATGIWPACTIQEARRLALATGPDTLLGGERGGRPVDGFDAGNSPLEYSRARVAGHPIVLTTTNGTLALHACRDASEVIVGAIINRSAVATLARSLAVANKRCDIHLVCAGTDGEVTEEDVLAAGAILEAAARALGAGRDRLDAASQAALAQYAEVTCPREALADSLPSDLAGAFRRAEACAIAAAFATSRGGRNLIDLEMQEDLAAAAAIDACQTVPIWHRSTGWLVAAASQSNLSTHT